jgi:hypothetical protein
MYRFRLLLVFIRFSWTLSIFRSSKVPQLPRCFLSIFLWMLCLRLRRLQICAYWSPTLICMRKWLLFDVYQWVGCFLIGSFDIFVVFLRIEGWCFENHLLKFWFLCEWKCTFLELLSYLLGIFLLYVLGLTFWRRSDLYYSIFDLAWVSRERRSAIFLSLSSTCDITNQTIVLINSQKCLSRRKRREITHFLMIKERFDERFWCIWKEINIIKIF